MRSTAINGLKGGVYESYWAGDWDCRKSSSGTDRQSGSALHSSPAAGYDAHADGEWNGGGGFAVEPSQRKIVSEEIWEFCV